MDKFVKILQKIFEQLQKDDHTLVDQTDWIKNLKITKYENDVLSIKTDQVTYDWLGAKIGITNFNLAAKKVFDSQELTINFDVLKPNQTHAETPHFQANHKAPTKGLVGIQEDLTFDKFIVTTPTKDLKKRVLDSWMKTKFDKSRFPIFIHGNAGTGKTHLVNAFANEWYAHHPNCNILYIPAGELSRQLQEARNKNNEAEIFNLIKEWILFYDVVIIDDFQMFSGRESALDLFFDIFNEMRTKNKLLFITSDRDVTSYAGLPDRFHSRLSGGIQFKMPVLDNQSCREFILIWIQKQGFELQLDDKATDLLCEVYTHDIRSLMGAIVTLETFYDSSINPVMTDQQVANYLGLKHVVKKTNVPEEIRIETAINADGVINAVSMQYNVSVDKIKGKDRSKSVVYARNVIIYILNKKLDFNHGQIADILNKERSTITTSLSKNNNLFDQDKQIQKLIDSIFKELHY